ncbi:MAG: dTMP kinase [Candidatus Dependentiae bacterium]|nr:dTMP kinase [Candidatus Dependentiae bacterium]
MSSQAHHPFKGTLITIEGIDGAGKSVLLHSLHQALIRARYSVVLTKEPGGTHIGKMLKKVLLEEEKECDPRVEFLLFAADRAEHFQKLVIPALTHGDIVISDRMADSAVAYQGYGRGVDPHLIQTVNRFAMHGIEPDITIYLRISPDEARKRFMQRHGTQSTMEREGKEFWERVVIGYEHLVASHSRIHTIDATLPLETVAYEAYEHVAHFLRTRSS